MSQTRESLDSLSAQIQRLRADAALEQSADRFTDLGASLRRRAVLTHDLQDYDAAVEAFETAANMTDSRDAGNAQRSSNLAAALYDRFVVTGDSADLDRAAMLASRAIESSSSSSPPNPEYLSNYAAVLYAKFQRSGSPKDLESAVAVSQEALELAPPGHKSVYLANLSTVLLAEFSVTGNGALLDRAVEYSRAAVRETDEGDPAWPSRLLALGQCLVLKARQDRSGTVGAEAISSLSRVVSAPSASGSLRITAAELATLGLTSGVVGNGALTIVDRALELTVHLPPGDELVTRRALLAADAAASAIRVGDLGQAAIFFDAGRVRYWTEQSRFRRDVEKLQTAAPYLANSLAEIKDRLGSLDEGQRMEGSTRLRLTKEWDELVERVRALPGFENFLREQDFETAQLPPGEVVVAVNMSRLRADAIVLQRGTVFVVSLPELNLETATKRAEEYWYEVLIGTSTQAPRIRELQLTKILSWLWEALAAPIVMALGLSRQPQLRDLPVIKWCLSGPLATLPVHAAGRYREDDSSEVKSLLELAACSYVLSIQDALGQRESTVSEPGRASSGPNALVVAPEAVGTSLLGVPMEVETLRHLLVNVNVLAGDEARRERMLQQMSRHSLVHFAGHGHWDPDHSARSGLVLKDGVLTVDRLSRKSLAGTDLIFLSASSTALGGFPPTNEFISPVAAFLAAGCPNIIGACFSVRDRDASEFATHFYKSLVSNFLPLESHSIALAANEAASQLRRKYPRTPSAWAGFVHATSGNRQAASSPAER